MKIDYNGQEMSIKLDKVPSLLYINEDGNGCGQVYLKGVRVKGVQQVNIKAESLTDKVDLNSLNYSVKYFDEKEKCSKVTQVGNMLGAYQIGIKLLDAKEFELTIRTIKQMISDERIPEEIRKEYAERFIASIKPDYIMYANGGEIVDWGNK